MKTKAVLVMCGIYLFSCISRSSGVNSKPIVCYWQMNSQTRSSYGAFDVNNINPSLCSFVMYAYFGITEAGEVVMLEKLLDLDMKNTHLREQNRDLKIFACIGGGESNAKIFSVISKSAAGREKFARNVLKFIMQHGFDGIDIHWEYPGSSVGGGTDDKNNFSLLLGALSRELKQAGKLLTAAMTPSISIADTAYNLPEISKYLNYFFVMSFDRDPYADREVGITSPLFDSPNKTLTFTIANTIKYYTMNGVPQSKLALGIPFYGRTYTLMNRNDREVNAPAAGGGVPGPYTETIGFLGYNEFCEQRLNFRYWMNQKRDEATKTVYAYENNQWISYDDEWSIGEKVAYAKRNNLGAVLVWSIDTDDFLGRCGRSYPLLRAVNKKWFGWRYFKHLASVDNAVKGEELSSYSVPERSQMSLVLERSQPNKRVPTKDSPGPIFVTESTTFLYPTLPPRMKSSSMLANEESPPLTMGSDRSELTFESPKPKLKSDLNIWRQSPLVTKDNNGYSILASPKQPSSPTPPSSTSPFIENSIPLTKKPSIAKPTITVNTFSSTETSDPSTKVSTKISSCGSLTTTVTKQTVTITTTTVTLVMKANAPKFCYNREVIGAVHRSDGNQSVGSETYTELFNYEKAKSVASCP